MNKTTSTPPVFVIEQTELLPRHADAVLDGAAAARADVAVLDVTGSGVIACLQGLLTNDVEALGDGAFVYGAVLTPKGMIVCDMWVERKGATATIVLPAHGNESFLDLARRSLPPRLARITDRTNEIGVLRIVGPEAVETAERAGIAVPPQTGQAAPTVVGDAACVVARPHDEAPFRIEIRSQPAHLAQLERQLEDAGAILAGWGALELGRVLMGWPRLGAEIDEKTLPQEVRYDEINGVSYTKGCYTGQETVARVHFRGHTNRGLVGLAWEGEPDPDNSAILQEDRPLGRVTSLTWLDPIEQYVGLGLVRRELNRDGPVTAAGSTASTVSLPFQFDA